MNRTAIQQGRRDSANDSALDRVLAEIKQVILNGLGADKFRRLVLTLDVRGASIDDAKLTTTHDLMK